MHIAHVVTIFVFAQTEETQVVIDEVVARIALQITYDSGVQCVQRHDVRVNVHADLLGETMLAPHQAERVSFAHRQWPDCDHRAMRCGEGNRRLLRLVGAETRYGEAFMVPLETAVVALGYRQIAARARGDGGARIRHGDHGVHRLVDAHPRVRYRKRGRERSVAH